MSEEPPNPLGAAFWAKLESENGGEDARDLIVSDIVTPIVNQLQDDDRYDSNGNYYDRNGGDNLWICESDKRNYNICRRIWERLWAEERSYWETEYPQKNLGRGVPSDNQRQDIPADQTRPAGFDRIIDLIKRRDGVELTSELPKNMSLKKVYTHLRGARKWAPRHWAGRRPIENNEKLRKLISGWGLPEKQPLIKATYGYPEAWITTRITSFFWLFNERFYDFLPFFAQPIGAWDTSSVVDMTGAFAKNEHFNYYIGRWDVSRVRFMMDMFYEANLFNQPLEKWDTSGCANMSGMFRLATRFNQPIGNWQTQNVTTMADMFAGARAFNQPIEQWNVTELLNTTGMFQEAVSFNQPLNGWHTTFKKIVHISEMFNRAVAFNQPLDQWDTSTVVSAERVFRGCKSFIQDITGWNKQSMNPESLESMERDAQSIKKERYRQEYLKKLRSASAKRTKTSSVVDQVFAFHKLAFH